MRKNLFLKIIFVILLTLTAFYVSLPPEFNLNFNLAGFSVNQKINRPGIDLKIGNFNIKNNFDLKLGLDLVGGSHLVFEADTSQLSSDKKELALEALRNIIEKRVNLFGISEPNILISSFDKKDRVIVELPGINNTQEAIDLVGKTAQLIFAEVGDGEEQEIKATDLTGADLKEADVAFDQVSGKPMVIVNFTTEGTQKFSDLTEKNVGKPLAILLDGELISAPLVQEKIAGGSAQISGQYDLEEAKRFAIQLNAGSLPVPISLVEQRTVGATLGNESIQMSTRAGIYGVIIVGIFMIVLYGKLGIISNIGLFIFGVLSLSLYKLIPVVLTLPGIAGFLLSVGMAVDSNILIFERFKEEKKIKTNVEDALEASFGRAWDSIRDANIATLITAFILANPLDWPFLHTSGPVRGFAITLALGIGISLFTGVFVSRNLLRLIIKNKK